jgi:large subunit ribosomal protein L24
MKRKFSTHWLSSKQPRKQRKYKANAPLHSRHKFLNAHLSKELQKKYGKRSFPLRKGDDVLVMRGSFKKKKAKISSVEPKRTRVVLENIQRSKKDGTKVNVYFHPSSLQIRSLNLDDKKRLAALSRSNKTREKENAPKKTKSNN